MPFLLPLVSLCLPIALVPSTAWAPTQARVGPSTQQQARPRSSNRHVSTVCVVAGELTVTVKRSSAGGLGIEVDERNTIATCADQPDLRVGDVIVAVDGVSLDNRPIAKVLERKEEYSFTIERKEGSRALEDLLIRLARQAGEKDNSGEDAEAIRRGVRQTVTQLQQQQGAPPTRESLLGFWRRRYVSDPSLSADGVTGYGGLPSCKIMGSWQLLQSEKEPALQVVEVIADGNLGVHQLGARKGDWEVAESKGALNLIQHYSKLEYAGAMQSAELMMSENVVVYVSEDMRIDVDDTAELIVVYERQPADVAMVQQLLSSPADRDFDSMPLWERADLARRFDRGGGQAGSATL
jgi:hypothetical protein